MVIVDMGTIELKGKDIRPAYRFGIAVLVAAVKAIFYVFAVFVSVHDIGKVTCFAEIFKSDYYVFVLRVHNELIES